MTNSTGYWLNLLNNESETPALNYIHEASGSSKGPSRKPKGVLRGAKRGKYENYSDIVRARILSAAENEEDWQTIATANGVKISTASNWVRRNSVERKSRGGLRQQNVKIRHEHVQALVDWLSENPQMTLTELAAKLLDQFHVTVTAQTVARHLELRMISLKDVHFQPETGNSLANKTKRREYVQAIMQVT